MLYTYHVDVGRMLAFDMDLAMKRYCKFEITNTLWCRYRNGLVRAFLNIV